MAEIGTDIDKAVALLDAGDLVAIPTETVYGLAGNALNADAVAKIFSVKDRPHFDPLIVHTSDLERASHWTMNIPPIARKLSENFWPGPLTLLFEKQSIIPDLVTSGLDTVGIRCPDHPITKQLLSKINYPLAAPSANPFGYVSPTNPQHVDEMLGNKIRYILDGGTCRIGIESTIVGFEQNQAIIYRMGGLSIEEIERVTGKVIARTASTARPQAPGQLSRHYSPRKKLLLGNINANLKEFPSKRIGILSFMHSHSGDHHFSRTLSPKGDLQEAAKNLFSALRDLDQLDIDLILAEEVPDVGIGRAINDRLRRAAFRL